MPDSSHWPLLALATLLLALSVGCGDEGGQTPSPGSAESTLGTQDRLQTIWQGNVVSSDRQAVCAQSGDQRETSFHAFVDPWLVGLPAESIPTDEDVATFLDTSCATQE